MVFGASSSSSSSSSSAAARAAGVHRPSSFYFSRQFASRSKMARSKERYGAHAHVEGNPEH